MYLFIILIFIVPAILMAGIFFLLAKYLQKASLKPLVQLIIFTSMFTFLLMPVFVPAGTLFAVPLPFGLVVILGCAIDGIVSLKELSLWLLQTWKLHLALFIATGFCAYLIAKKTLFT
jgi:hypothetical protein